MQVQLHDFNGGIAPSGLFWTVRVPDDALRIHGRRARLEVKDLDVIDSFTFLGANQVPARVSFEIDFRAYGDEMRFEPGSTDPTDPSNFEGRFRFAVATGRFEGTERGFRFRADDASSAGVFAEMGHERNGAYLRRDHDDDDDEDQIAQVETDAPEASAVHPEVLRALPNPAAAATAIEFTLRSADRVSLEILDVSGRRVAALLGDSPLPAGRHVVRWDLRDGEGRRSPPGVYLVNWRTADNQRRFRIVVLP